MLEAIKQRNKITTDKREVQKKHAAIKKCARAFYNSKIKVIKSQGIFRGTELVRDEDNNETLLGQDFWEDATLGGKINGRNI